MFEEPGPVPDLPVPMAACPWCSAAIGDPAPEGWLRLGSGFGLEPILTQSAYFRVHNRDDSIPNLYFVGAGTHPGAGIPGVVGSAKATAKLMLEDLL